MKRITPTLLALAIAPCAMALDFTQSDADVKLGLSLQLQVRAQVSSAAAESAGNVEPYDVQGGTVGRKADDVDFLIRRARFGFKGSYQDSTKFALIMTSDKFTSGTNPVSVYQAWVGREFKGEKLTHYVQAGLNSAFFNSAANINSSTTSLLPAGRASEALLAPRIVGVQYIMTAPYVTWGVDVGNNTGDDTTGVGATEPRGEGLTLTTRAQISPEGDWKIAKAQDTWMGKAGKGIMFAVEGGMNQRDATGAAAGKSSTGFVDLNGDGDQDAGEDDVLIPGSAASAKSVTTQMVGAEVLLHMDAISALAAANYQIAKTTNGNGKDDTQVGSNVYVVQVGYAMPCMMAPANVVEPAVRVQRINSTNDDKVVSSYGSNTDFGGEGYQYDLGANYYFNAKANNKLSVQYTYWKAESGDGRAHIGMAQYQLYF